MKEIVERSNEIILLIINKTDARKENRMLYIKIFKKQI